MIYVFGYGFLVLVGTLTLSLEIARTIMLIKERKSR